MKKFNEFISIFNNDDQLLLKIYFSDLSNKIFLNKKDTKLFINDFEKAILYYYKKNKSIKDALTVLELNNIGNFYKNNFNRWYPLDYAAKIYPLSMKKNFMQVFRISVYLKEDVIPEILQIALTFSIKRFPTFATTVRKGFFWHYLDGIKRRFAVYEENDIPCSKINVSNLTKKTFKMLYYKNRISVEFFHVLTDGTGGSVFLKTVVAEYYKLLGTKIDYTEGILNINENPLKEELNNDFLKFEKSNKKETFIEKKALQLDGNLSLIKPCQVIHFDLNLEEVKKICHKKNITITNLFLGFIFMACNYSTSKNGYIRIQVPVNLRKYYDSKTLRNFALYSIISIKKSDIKDFDTLLNNIKTQLEEKITKEKMNNTMAHTSKLINSIKFIPLFIKKPIATLAYGFLGDKVLTTVLSNLGEIKYPTNLKIKIEKMDFLLGTTNINRSLFTLISCNNVLAFTMTKLTTNMALENNIYNLIKSMDLKIKVSGSDVYENK